MTVSALDLFTIGIGPSSSHTVGPMRAARRFAERLVATPGAVARTSRLHVELLGSLGATGRGHGSDRAVVLGLTGETPEAVDPAAVAGIVAGVRAAGCIRLPGGATVAFDPDTDLVMARRGITVGHPNTLRFRAVDAAGDAVLEATYASVGGGFVVEPLADGRLAAVPVGAADPLPFTTAVELLVQARAQGLAISGVMLANENARRPEAETRAALLAVWDAMQGCVAAGCAHEGNLPGGLGVRRRAPELARALARGEGAEDPLAALDWLTVWALAVSEENAAGGRVVTAPTNGAAGILPAVLHFHMRWSPGAERGDAVRFLLTAAAIGVLYKENASISGAEVGCQGEVGAASSMAAGALAEVLGGSPEQVENAAEIAMEHNLGLTCDPVGGLVQVPCIERNAVGAVKAVTAARLALRGDGTHIVSLDRVIRTMRDTGADMKTKYKETSRGGLAVNVVEC